MPTPSATNRQTSTVAFYGAAGTVTGSKHLVSWEGGRVLLDCGLFQGLKELRLRNWAEPPFDPRSLDALVLSHAHLDHSGYLPLLVKRGFRGPIYCTAGTAALLRVLLPDSAHLMEEEANFANRHGYSKHHPALPLYTREDVEKVFPLLQPQPYEHSFEVARELHTTLRRAGHILGSASVELRWAASGRRLVFSGDLGRWGRPILRDPDVVSEADVLLIESTYGDRLHAADARAHLARVISETAHRGGAVLIPAFAVGRVQELIWTLRQLEDAGEVPLLSVYLDSPMAIDVSEMYCQHPEYERGHGTGALPQANVLRVQYSAEAAVMSPMLPGNLTTIATLPAPVRTRSFMLSEQMMPMTSGHNGHGSSSASTMMPMFTINGQVYPNVPIISAKLGEVEQWEVMSDEAIDHPFHIHGFSFQVLSREGVPEPIRAWKDTVNIKGKETLKLAVRLDGFVGKWLYHCHILEHAENGMMGELDISP